MRKFAAALFAALFAISTGAFAASHAGGKDMKADSKKDDM